MKMDSRQIVLFSILSAISLQIGCGSSDISGKYKVHRDACIASQGQYKLDKSGEEQCLCFFNSNSNPVICKDGDVCDANVQACSSCKEEDSFCNDGKIHVCIGGQWQEQACPTGSCSPDRKLCKSTDVTQIHKEICCSATKAGTDEYKACINNKDKELDSKAIVKYVNGVPVTTQCAIGCSEKQEDGEIIYSCLPCNDDIFKDRCEAKTDDKGNKKAELTQCNNGYEIKSKCISNECKIANEDERAECNDITECNEGMTRCLKDGDNYKQEQCRNKIWEDMEVTCYSDLGCNNEKTACIQAECSAGEYKCNQEIYYICQNRKWSKQEVDEEERCKGNKNDSLIFQCSEGEFKCKKEGDDYKYFECNNNTWNEAEDTNNKCKNGDTGLTVPVCEDGEFKCKKEGDNYKYFICDENHQWVADDTNNNKCNDDASNCKTNDDCTDSNKPICNDGNCVECTGNKYRCIDEAQPHLEQCQNAQWVKTKECASCENQVETDDARVCQDESEAGCKDNETKCDENGMYTCNDGTWSAPQKCDNDYSCNSEKTDCGVCTDDTYQCSSSTPAQLQKCIEGRWGTTWEKTEDERNCDICNKESGIPTNNLSEICSQAEPCNDNGYYRLNDQNEIELCANQKWVEDIQKYNKILKVDFDDDYRFELITNDIKYKEFPQNFHAQFKEDDNNANFDDFLNCVEQKNECKIYVIDDDIVNEQLSSYMPICVDAMIDGYSITQSFPIKINFESYIRPNLILEVQKCEHGCNSDRTACAEDGGAENGIFMSWYTATSGKPSFYKQGNEVANCQNIPTDISSNKCQLILDATNPETQICVDIYDDNYVKSSYKIAQKNKIPEVLPCTTRCNDEWSDCDGESTP